MKGRFRRWRVVKHDGEVGGVGNSPVVRVLRVPRKVVVAVKLPRQSWFLMLVLLQMVLKVVLVEIERGLSWKQRKQVWKWKWKVWPLVVPRLHLLPRRPV